MRGTRWLLAWGTALLGVAFLVAFVWGNIGRDAYSLAQSLLVLSLSVLCFTTLFVFAVCARRKRLAVATGVVVLVLLALVLLHLGPHSRWDLECRVCGRYRTVVTLFGVTCYDKECESDLSRWYQKVGLPEHEHQWAGLWGTEKPWGTGPVTHYDTFGMNTTPLRLLREVWERVDDATFKTLAEQFMAIGEDRSAILAFCKRCHAFLPAEEASETEANERAD